MTSVWKRIGLGLTLLAAASVSASAATQTAAPVRARPVAAPARPASPAPPYIRDRVNDLGRAFNGSVGIAVKSIDEGWSTGWKAEDLYPQQSVSKLWVSITAMDAVDRGKVSLNDPVTLTRSDLTVFHQPIRDLVIGGGGYTTTLSDLMVRAITTSDNTANDKLMRSVDGPEAVRSMIREKRVG